MFVAVFLCLVPIITDPSPRYFIALVLIALGVAVYVPLVFYRRRPQWMGAYVHVAPPDFNSSQVKPPPLRRAQSYLSKL
jgi:hypothetical protein